MVTSLSNTLYDLAVSHEELLQWFILNFLFVPSLSVPANTHRLVFTVAIVNLISTRTFIHIKVDVLYKVHSSRDLVLYITCIRYRSKEGKQNRRTEVFRRQGNIITCFWTNDIQSCALRLLTESFSVRKVGDKRLYIHI